MHKITGCLMLFSEFYESRKYEPSYSYVESIILHKNEKRLHLRNKSMRSLWLIMLFYIMLLPFICKGQSPDGSIFERRISISQQNQSLDFILEQISWQANVFFSYDASIINAEKKYIIDANNKSLYTILNQLFDSNKFNFSELENQIIISKKVKNKNVSKTTNDSIPVKYYFLSGKLIENKKGRPIKYASVSVIKKPIGTISNTDGEFILKIHPNLIQDTIIISCMGYAQLILPARKLLDEDIFILNPISIRIKEVKVSVISPTQLLKRVRNNYAKNYTRSTQLMTAFYRETVKQDNSYINVSEAVLEILKSPYENTSRSDLVRLLKARKNPDVQTFKWLNFKLQGGPFTITQLDVIKTVENFINPEYEKLYNYHIDRVIWYNKYPVYVVRFHPISFSFFPAFEGEMYVHRETFALLHANYRITKTGLKKAKEVMIMKKPRTVKAGPSYVQYTVSYQQYRGKWHLASAQASVKFKVKSKRDKLNSEFHSVSDLLITDIKPSELKKFTRDEKFTRYDIFVEMLGDFDEKFWKNYNIIKPNEDLRKAFKHPDLNE